MTAEHRYNPGDRVEVRSRCTGGVRRWVAATVVQAEEGYAEVAHDDGKPSQRYIYSTRDVRPLRAAAPVVYRVGDHVEVPLGAHWVPGQVVGTVGIRGHDAMCVATAGDINRWYGPEHVRPLREDAEYVECPGPKVRDNALCLHCGGPAYVGLAAMECMREGGCAVPAEPEPERVLHVPVRGERVWQAYGDGESKLHPIREEAIRLWRAERRKRMGSAAQKWGRSRYTDER
jgi:hypothetical protein